MNLDEVCRQLKLANFTPELSLDGIAVKGGYVSDLLSDVLAHAGTGAALVTVQSHMNVVAVAVHAGIAAVIFAGDRKPEEAVRLKAVEEHIPLLGSPASAFELVGRLYAAGVRGDYA